MASSKRKQDEKHLKMLRELAALSHNKHCFDCHQRGPTYVNMTTGSYVCTSCSGILRGLNPPHRVKSISMASFTPEELEFLRCHGNELCRKTWLGLYDNRSGMEPDSRDEQKVKDFMSQKYERKRFYVAPTDAMKEEAKQMNESPSDKQAQTKPLKSLLGGNTPSLVVQNNQSPQQTHKASTQPPPVVAPQSTKESTPSSFPSPGQTSQSSQSSGSATIDLLGDLGGDPFGSSAPAPAPPPANLGGGGGSGGFADFSSFNQFPPPTQPNPAFQTVSNPLVPMGSTSTSNGLAFGGVTSAPPTASSDTAPAGVAGSKYSNLADLFSSPVSETASESSASVNWSGGSGGGIGSTTGIHWGGGSSSTSSTDAGGINWGVSSGGMGGASSSGGGISWGNPGATTSVPNSTFSGSGANPFGGGGTTVQTQSSVGGANPFAGGGQPMFGQTAGSSFGQPAAQNSAGFGAGSFGQPAQAGGGFGQPGVGGGFGQQGVNSGGFGQPAASSGAFGQPAVSSGGFGQPAASSGGFGQPVASSGGFGQPAASSGGFGQPSVGMGGFGQPSSTAQGFGQFGGAPQPGGGFGQFGVQNGGGGGFGGGMGGQATPSFGAFSQAPGSAMTSQGQFDNKNAGFYSQQQPGFGTAAPGGWGQGATPQSANPFMSAAQVPIQPKTGSTNPFL